MTDIEKILSLWIETGKAEYHRAALSWFDYKNPRNIPDARVWLEVKAETIYEQENIIASINDVLYSPESNFFEVTKWKYAKEWKYYIWKYMWTAPFDDEIDIQKYHKMQCALSPDPIQYLLDNIDRWPNRKW